MAQRESVVRMSVEQPLWRALTVYRPLTLLYAVGLSFSAYDTFHRPVLVIVYFAVLAAWTSLTWRQVTSAAACPRWFLAADLGLALAGILLTPVAVDPRVLGGPTLPSIWTAGSVLAFALKGGWRWAAGAAALVGVADIVQRGALSRGTLHNVLLVWVVAIGIGYVIEVARTSERTLARALEIEAATRERERLARDIHDGVLQVLAMVQRRSSSLGGEAAELGRLAGEQEAALRALVTSGLTPAPSARTGNGRDARARDERARDQRARDGSTRGEPGGGEPRHDRHDQELRDQPLDLRSLLAPYAGTRVTLSQPGGPVLLAEPVAKELAAAVGAALDNVHRHAGEHARAWILIEDESEAVMVTVRDDGPGIPDGRLAEAAQEGRLGVALSIRGRLRDIGGRAELISVPGQGTEVELTVPRPTAAPGRAG